MKLRTLVSDLLGAPCMIAVKVGPRLSIATSKGLGFVTSPANSHQIVSKDFSAAGIPVAPYQS